MKNFKVTTLPANDPMVLKSSRKIIEYLKKKGFWEELVKTQQAGQDPYFLLKEAAFDSWILAPLRHEIIFNHVLKRVIMDAKILSFSE